MIKLARARRTRCFIMSWDWSSLTIRPDSFINSFETASVLDFFYFWNKRCKQGLLISLIYEDIFMHYTFYTFNWRIKKFRRKDLLHWKEKSRIWIKWAIGLNKNLIYYKIFNEKKKFSKEILMKKYFFF